MTLQPFGLWIGLLLSLAFPAYRHAAIDIRVYGPTLHSTGAIVRDVTYSSPVSGRITAYIVAPTAGTSHTGVLFAHWAIGNRSEFLPEAIDLARRYGVVSILPDAPQFRPAPWTHAPDGNITHPERDVALYQQTVIDLRRSLDVLIAQKGVDPQRIGVVGHSFDAAMAGVLSGVDHRPKIFILMAGSGRTSLAKSAYQGSFFNEQAYKQMFAAFPRKTLENYVAAVAQIDADHYVRHAAPARIFMQFARQDPYVTSWSAGDYYAAASEPKSMKWYLGGHELMSAQAVADRTAALVGALDLHVIAGVKAPLVTVTDKNNGKTVRITVGQSIEVRLPSNPTTGYKWASSKLGEALNEVRPPAFQASASKLMGAGGTQVFSYRGVSPGTVQLSFDYARPWEHVAPAKHIAIMVIVLARP